MKQITIRNIPVEIETLIKEEAKTNGISLNKACIEILKQATGNKKNKNKTSYHVAGILTEEETSELNKNIQAQREIDKELRNHGDI